MRLRAKEYGDDGSFLRTEIEDRILDRLEDINRQFDHALIIGSPSPKTWPAKHVTYASSLYQNPHAAVAIDEEALPFQDNSFDLIISLLDLHWVNDLPGALIQFNRALRPDGLFLSALFSAGSLAALKDCFLRAESICERGASPHIAPFADVRDLGALLQRAGFAMPVTDQDTVDIRYSSLFHLLEDLRKMGETNALRARCKSFSSRQVFLKAAEFYAQNYHDAEERIIAHFNIAYLTGWAPAPGQPRPKRPGTATARLADALHTKEEKL